MTTNYVEAIDEIFGTFNAAWQAGAAGIVGYVPEVRYVGVELPTSPASGKFWARLSSQGVKEPQATFNGVAVQRYTAYGLIFVQLFCPKSVSNSMQLGRKLAELTKNCYKGVSTQNCVWFRNGRIQELEPEDLFYRFNIVTEYEYDTLN